LETIGLGHLKFSVIQFEVFTDTLQQGLGQQRHNCQKVLDNIMVMATVEIVTIGNKEYFRQKR
jgi:hypothetical protein